MAVKNKLQTVRSDLNLRWEKFKQLFPRIATMVRWSWRLAYIIFLIDTGYLIGVWPDWKIYSNGDVPKSMFIRQYERLARLDASLPRLRWNPIPLNQIPTYVFKSILSAEDANFFQHEGFDTDAFKQAMEYNWEQKRLVYGASTISQQTVKNLFLSESRNPMRKWHEIVLTIAMEQSITKRRILELYLNSAEFGRGIYGVNAAAEYYWGISASDLTLIQAIELAATLPAPVNHNPKTRTKFFLKHRAKIMRHMGVE